MLCEREILTPNLRSSVRETVGHPAYLQSWGRFSKEQTRRFSMAEMCSAFTSQGSVQAGHWTGGPAPLQTEARQSLAVEAQRLQQLAQQRLGASAVVPSFQAFLASRHPTVAPNALIRDSAAPPFPSADAHASAPQPSSPEQAGSGESSSPVTPSTPLRSAPSSAPSSPLHSPAEPAEPPATTAGAAPCAAGAEPPAEPPAVEVAVEAPAESLAEPPPAAHSAAAACRSRAGAGGRGAGAGAGAGAS